MSERIERTYVITGSASGIGLATTRRLRDVGHRVIGVDLHDADITADLSSPRVANQLVDEVRAATGGRVEASSPAPGSRRATRSR